MAPVRGPAQPAPGPCALCPLRGLGELWAELDTPGSHYRYEVSSHGRVRNATTGRPMRLQPQHKGYLEVNLGREYRHQAVHRLVALAFIGLAPADGQRYETDHLDFDRHNNRWTNLRWLRKAENAWRWAVDKLDPAEVARWTDDAPASPQPENLEPAPTTAPRESPVWNGGRW